MTYRITQVVVLVFLLVVRGEARSADSSSPNTAAPAVESLTAQVRGLLAEPFAPYPDPWKPRRERPKAFCVVPGEKLSYPERMKPWRACGRAASSGAGSVTTTNRCTWAMPRDAACECSAPPTARTCRSIPWSTRSPCAACCPWSSCRRGCRCAPSGRRDGCRTTRELPW